MYDDTDFCLETAPITRVMAIKAKGSANYGPPCKSSKHITREHICEQTIQKVLGRKYP